MGYDASMFSEIGNLALPSERVLDIGAQDVVVASERDRHIINQFIARKNPTNIIGAINSSALLEAKEIYERAGYQYTAIDVDERPETIRIDLASFQIPKKRKHYGLIVNTGTTEHLSSPVATFALMHELCATGGFIYNDVPLFGFGNHGLINPTPKFWHALIWMNQYNIITTKIRSIDEALLDKGNLYHDYLSYFEGLSDIANNSYIIRAIFQKTTSSLFVPPYDAVFPNTDDGKSLATLLAGSYLPFIKTGAYTKDQVVNGINDFLKLNHRPYVVKSYDELSSQHHSLTDMSYLQRLFSKFFPATFKGFGMRIGLLRG
jgi:hypothetical protein